MKRILLIIYILLVGPIYAQSGLSATENYIYEKNCLNGDCSKKVETVKYYDGLGRIKQSISIKATPLGKDVVVPTVYDAYGRQVRDYLPVPQTLTQNGAIYTAPFTNATAIYGNEKIYAERIPESSPLDRTLKQKQPGNDWDSHPINFSYSSNTANEVKKYTVATTWIDGRTNSVLSLSGTYPANSLFKSTVTDEDGTIITEYKNRKGQVILSRKIDGTQTIDTYQVYNEFNKLAYTIPPLAAQSGLVDATTLDNLCYQYRYDGWNRLVEKKIPGKGWEYMVYDKADRLIMSQDAKLRSASNWMFTKYDQFGRVAYTGISTTSSTRQTLQSNAYSNANIYESRTANVFTRNGMPIYYSNSATPTNVTQVLSINYYDTYPPYSFNPPFPQYILGNPVITDDSSGNAISTRSLPVMTTLKNIEDDNWTTNYNYYDNKERVIATHSVNHLGGYTRVESRLDFAGVPLQTITRHKRLAADAENVITETFTYDSQNRLLIHKHQVDNNPEEILAQNTYNEISQLTNKKVGGTVASNPLQSIDYTYNIRGWITSINDLANLGSDLFGYKINYNQVEGLETPNSDYPTVKVKPRYNGTIAEVLWKTLIEENEPLKKYGYSYDQVNRIAAGFYQKAGSETAKEYFEKIDYDLNGNISRLKRSEGLQSGGTFATLIDNLKYVYDGNKLVNVTDEQLNPSGYPTVPVSNTITYDDNGNMTSHRDKNLGTIEYNILNLANKITTTGTKLSTIHRYLYRADGVKVSTSTVAGTETSTTEYLDGFQYFFYVGQLTPMIPTGLQFVSTAEGYYDFTNNAYIYNFVDQLGNVRLSYTDYNKDGVIQPRRYYVKECGGPSDPMNCIDYWKPGEIVDINNYYPFGLLHNYTVTTQNAYQYKYNGKELLQTGMYDYGWRQYMPELGRWNGVDPLAENYYSTSPFAYVANNPIHRVDVDGRAFNDDGTINTSGYSSGFVPRRSLWSLSYSGDGGGADSGGIYAMAGGNGVQFTGVYAQMLFEMFLENLTSSGDSNIKTFHFVPEDVTPNIYRHTLNAFLNGKPSILHYDADLKRRAQRRKEATAKYPTIKGMQRDEYPYASTFEGGVQPDGSVAMMAYVPEAENRSQGGSLSVLYRAAGLKTGDAFMVIPVPKGSSPEEVKQEVFERLNPHPLPVGPSHPSIGNPVIPYKQWPLMMGAAVVVGLIMYARFMPVY